MLDPKQKENWLKALRSGEYEQTKGTLYRSECNSYCCIGVFGKCNNIPISENGEHFEGSITGYDPLSDQIGSEETEKLWRMNDQQDKCFLEIADYIEINL